MQPKYVKTKQEHADNEHNNKVESKTLLNGIPDSGIEDKVKSERERALKESIQRQYIRVGDKYFKLVYKPDKYGRKQRTYMERQKSTIIDDFGSKTYLRYVKKYEGTCVVASHIDYREEIEGWFNEYAPLSHMPQDGNFDTILSILQHVFGDKINFIMDYLHLLYVRPIQRLPIILLESKERNTGKSTFGALLKLIFQDNAIKLGNSDFESDFNAIWVKSLCVIVDETSLDSKGVMQMIKRLSTETNKVTSNEKNKAQTQIEFIGKFIFMSNDEGKALPIERGENRFAVFKVPTFKEAGLKEDPNIEQKILVEIPAFLHHLANMKLFYPEVGRMFFPPHAYHTKQLEVYYEGSQSYTAKAVQNFISDCFAMFPDQTVFHYSLSDLLTQLSMGGYAKKADRAQLRKALENELSLTLTSKRRYERFNLYNADTGGSEIHNVTHCNNCVYEFFKDRLFKAS